MKSLRNMGAPEFFLARSVFNLAAETGDDPERVARELREAEQRRRDATEYERKYQRTLAECPGFCACDAPSGPGSKGKVVIEPGMILEANRWLRRRFHVSENLELSGDTGLVLEIIPHQRRLPVGGKRIKVHFGKVEQFELALP